MHARRLPERQGALTRIRAVVARSWQVGGSHSSQLGTLSKRSKAFAPFRPRPLRRAQVTCFERLESFRHDFVRVTSDPPWEGGTSVAVVGSADRLVRRHYSKERFRPGRWPPTLEHSLLSLGPQWSIKLPAPHLTKISFPDCRPAERLSVEKPGWTAVLRAFAFSGGAVGERAQSRARCQAAWKTGTPPSAKMASKPPAGMSAKGSSGVSRIQPGSPARRATTSRK